MTKLFIAEKPEMGEAIALALGEKVTKGTGFFNIKMDNGKTAVVSWALGHILRLKYPSEYDEKYEKWNLENLPIDYPPVSKAEFVLGDPGKKKQLDILGKLISEAEEIIHAGDNDDEGQLIVDSILMYFDNKKPVKRLFLNSAAKEDVIKEYQSIESNDKYKNLTKSALARTASDMLYGFNLSQLYTLMGNKKGLDTLFSVGRVQTPTLGLIIKRYNDHFNHITVDYINIVSEFSQGPINFKAKLILPENSSLEVTEKGQFLNESEVQSVIDSLKSLPPKINLVDKKLSKEAPPLPYNATYLQRDAFKIYGYSPKKLMEITQSLRETHKCITYNRTDDRYLKDSAHEGAPAIFDAMLSNFSHYKDIPYDLTLKSKAFDESKIKAHHGIIPTCTVLEDPTKLSKEEFNVYKLIADRFFLQFMPPQESEVTTLEISVGEYLFKKTYKKVIKEGFKAFDKTCDIDANIEGEDTEFDISAIRKEGEITLISSEAVKGKTKPPALYDSADLIMDLTRIARFVDDPVIKKALIDKDKDKQDDHGSIGTGATRHLILPLLMSRELIEENKSKKLIPTEKGLAFAKALPVETLKPDMTAQWYMGMAEIQDGTKDLDEFMGELQAYLTQHVKDVKENGLDLDLKDLNVVKCPGKECEGYLSKREGKNSFFWGCSEFRNGCKETYQDVGNKPLLDSYVCPSCNAHDLFYFNKDKRAVWLCSGMKEEECFASFEDKKGKPDLTIHECPECKKNPLRRIKSESKFFWGCSGYNNPKDPCKASFRDYKGKPDFNVYDCPECASGHLNRFQNPKNKKMFFWSCSEYKNGCKTAVYDINGAPDLNIHKCPNCPGTLRRHQNPKDKTKYFWGCSEYKNGCLTVFNDSENSPAIPA